MLTETEKAYLAGFFDGDGCVHISKYRKAGAASPVYVLQVILVQSQRDIFDRWQQQTGLGNIYRMKTIGSIIPHKKQMYRWAMTSQQARYLLQLMLPYLYIKQEQARIALKFQDTMHYGNCRGTPSSILKLRESYRCQLSALKRGKVIEPDERQRNLERQMSSQLSLPF